MDMDKGYRKLWTVWLIALLGVSQPMAAAKPSDAEIARFLNHATFGATDELIAQIKAIGYEAFLDRQFALPLPQYPNYPDVANQPDRDVCNRVCRRDQYSAYPLQVTFFRRALTGEDQLRQRVAFALSQILVVSAQDNQLRMPGRLQPYLQLLDQHAFGNYRQLLKAITLNPAMGVYLDMAGNRKDAPNENYARELLQLFSIGLYELNPDGSRKKDKTGQPLPSFDQTVINQFARVLTGWSVGQSVQDKTLRSFATPMIEQAKFHDNGSKTLLRGQVVPAGLAMADELDAALGNLFTHGNMAPFISRQLIQHLVVSNPSAQYVERTAKVFQSSGGDMKAVLRAILLDREALRPPTKTAGHLREPILWLTHLLRAFKTTAANSDFVLGESFLPAQYDLSQDLYRSPSVFNYFPPDYQPPTSQLQGPEFAIYSTSTAFNRANLAYALIYKQLPTGTDRPQGTWLDLAALQPLATDTADLLDELDRRMLHGNMSSALRKALLKGLAPLPSSERARNAVYWIATSPDYLIER